MNKRIQGLVLLVLFMTGLLMMGASCFMHPVAKPIHTQIKAASKGDFELVAELEEDESELENHQVSFAIPFLHYLFENGMKQNASNLIGFANPVEKTHQKTALHISICLFRI